MIRINLFINFHAQVDQGEISSAGPLRRVRGFQLDMSQASYTSQKFWSTAGWCPESCSLLMVAADGSR